MKEDKVNVSISKEDDQEEKILVDKAELREMVKSIVSKKLNPVQEKRIHKITKSQLNEFIARATQKIVSEVASEKDSGVGDYASDIDKWVSESVDSLDKLIEAGEKLMAESPTHDYAIQERNHIVQARIGILKGLKQQLVKVMEDLYRKV
jgi:6-pyruvoyl-tetrahydropterin synthase